METKPVIRFVNSTLCSNIPVSTPTSTSMLKDDQQLRVSKTTNKCNIEEDQRLSEVVRRHPCLYDKLNNFYKDKDAKEKAWEAVESELGVEQGVPKKQFEILKKRYSRKRQTLKAALRSEIGAKDVESAQKDLDEYAFLSWLDPHIRLYRKTYTHPENQFREYNFPLMTSTTLATLSNHSNHAVTESDDDMSDVNGRQISIGSSSDDDDGSVNYAPKKKKIKRIETSSSNDKSTKVGIQINNKSKTGDDQRLVARVEMDVMSNMSKILQHFTDQEDLFGQMIAGELRTFPESIKCRVKHEISTVIFNYKLLQLGSKD